jgi:ribonuclease HI
MNITIHFDGSCWINPGGLARYGYTIICNEERVDIVGSGECGEHARTSNNFAELWALSEALEDCIKLSKVLPVRSIAAYGDSQIAINLMKGGYRARREKLYYPQYVRAQIAREELERDGIAAQFIWIPRERNDKADRLSKGTWYNASPEMLNEAENLLDNAPERC